MRETVVHNGTVISNPNALYSKVLSYQRCLGNECAGRALAQRRNRSHTGQRFSIKPFAIIIILVLFVSTYRVGVVADEVSPTSEALLDNNGGADGGQIEIPENFGMPSYETESPTEAPLPSRTPSIEPSIHPSDIPSSSPSTPYPTVTPMPTDKPSVAPTNMPSTTPSEFPSAMPTLSCHDVAAYESPINNLTCEDHADTDCTQWRHIGLNITELQELIENCPVTCNVPCGYFSTLNTNISFWISHVPGLIDDFMSRGPLEETTREYLTQFILERSPISKFALTQVDLLFQEPLNSTVSARIEGRSNRRLGSTRGNRFLQNVTDGDATFGEGFIHLHVILNLQGFKIYPIKIVLTDLMLAGIDSPEYTARLRQADIFYANATASSASQAEPRNVTAPTPEPESKMSSPVGLIVIATIVACLVVFGVAFYVKRAKIRGGCKESLPVDGENPQQSNRSIRGNIFSFDLSPASSTGVGGRLVAMLSGDASGESTNPSSGDEEASPVQSSEKSTSEEHPLTGVIPPMLVIDNIESPDRESSGRSIPSVIGTKRTKAVVPTRRMEASAKFIEALNKSQRGRYDSSSSDLMYSISSLESGLTGTTTELVLPGHRALAAVLSGDRTIDDESSVSSTPIKGSDQKVDMPLRRTLSSGQLTDDIDVDKVLDEFMKSQQDWEYTGKTDDTSSEEEVSVSPTHRVVKSASYERSPEKLPRAKGGRLRSNSWDKGNRASLSDAKTVVRRGSRRNLNTMESQASKSSSRTSGASPTHRRRNSKNGSSRGGSQSSGELFIPDGEALYVFEASHRGFLGLAIEPCQRGTRIRSVKEYSPLYGLVEAGDRIIEVDGVETTYKTTAGVAELLRRKKGRNKKIRLTVLRKTTEMDGIPALPVTSSRSRSKSFGSIPPQVPVPSNQMDFRGLTRVTDLDTSYVGAPASTFSDDAGEEEVPFHFIGAAPYEEPDNYATLSDSCF